MLKMKVTEKRARQMLQSIQHGTCQKGVTTRWDLDNGKKATAQRICWLFCWAATGQGSDKAMQEAKRAFNAIFDHSYDWLNGRPRFNLDIARRLRYRTGDIEHEFRSYL